ncbi:MAG: hypothetical protein FJ387_21635 [Verrucomicrobia bacterium]|nr:hypothetical protein [Verrucomicrobiota bacterium]
MTAFCYLAVTSQRGSWLFAHDGGASGKPWSTLTWVASTHARTTARVEVRAAETVPGLPGQGTVFNPIREAASRVPFSGVVGRYLEARLSLASNWTVARSPGLYDLTVHCPEN